MEYKKRIRFLLLFSLSLVEWMCVCVFLYNFWVRQRRVPGCCLKHTISITARQPEGNFNFHLSDVQWCRCTSFRFHHLLILFHSFIHSVLLRFVSAFDHSSHSFTSVFSVFTESWIERGRERASKFSLCETRWCNQEIGVLFAQYYCVCEVMAKWLLREWITCTLSSHLSTLCVASVSESEAATTHAKLTQLPIKRRVIGIRLGWFVLDDFLLFFSAPRVVHSLGFASW